MSPEALAIAIALRDCLAESMPAPRPMLKGARKRRWPTLPDSLYWDPTVPEPPRAPAVFARRIPFRLSQLEAQLARLGVYDAYGDPEIWRFSEIRRRARARRRAGRAR